MKGKVRRISCATLATVMAASLAAGSVLAFADNKSGAEFSSTKYNSVSFTDVTGKVDLSQVALNNLSPSVIENAAGSTFKNTVKTVIVTLDGDSVLDTLPSNANAAEYISSYAGRKVQSSIKKEQESFLSSLKRAGIDYEVKYSYTNVTNAVAIRVNTAYLSTIKRFANVSSAVVSQTYSVPETVDSRDGVTENPHNIYATGIYDSSDCEYQGEGMVVAVLDTGLDYTHDAFLNMPADATTRFKKADIAKKLADKDFKAVERSGATVDDLYINAKVPFAYDYADSDADVYPSYSNHGTHVAGIVAGKDDSYTNKEGETVNEEFRGVAPEAQLVICKVFTDRFDNPDLGGAVSEDIVAALEDCVSLDVDIINMSLGTVSGFSSIEIGGDDEGAMLNSVYQSIKDAGINLVCAASNEFSSGYGSAFGTNLASNPDSGTVGSPSTFVGALSVASINGQQARYMVTDKNVNIFYTDSSDENSVANDFLKDMLGKLGSGVTRGTFKYVVVPGIGRSSDYISVESILKDKSEGPVIAVVSRGSNTFQDKVRIAKEKGADAIIIANNVAGNVRMTVGDLEDPIPAISVTLNSGIELGIGKSGYVGKITLDANYLAGPFMNDYSSWGTTPDLKLKPEITSHGGEITSTVPGNAYDELSGTSMACPNLAGFNALVRQYLKTQRGITDQKELTRLTNQLTMSTAIIVRDEDGDPYSPRKQGAGLANFENVFNTQAYLFTDEANGGAEDNRPKVELGDDKNKKGVYEFDFYVRNAYSSQALEFTPEIIFMTETISADGLAVAEKAKLLNGSPEIKVNGVSVAYGEKITVAKNTDAKISVKLTLSAEEKSYLDKNFKNGMFIEGFVKLVSETNGQCDLTLPYMGFYGNWKDAPMLDYDCYEIAEFEQDGQYNDDNPAPQPQVWATQAYAMYYNNRYTVPMGSYVYVQDDNPEVQQIYCDPEHAAISHFNEFNGETARDNYLTTTGLKALYAGLLRNAAVVTYNLYDDYTGELIKTDNKYRVNKAYSNGGGGTPAQVLLELTPEELGLVANGKYKMEFSFYFDVDDYKNGNAPAEDTFSMVFYVDYEAPILEDARIRYYNYKDENNNDKQTVYLDLDVFDNHYMQSVMLCYSEDPAAGEDDVVSIKLATDYITPVYNAVKNGTNTVSIDITHIYDAYSKGEISLYVQLDDYALNHMVYSLNMFLEPELPTSFEIAQDDRITVGSNGVKELTIGVNEAFKFSLDNIGEANIADFTWVSQNPFNVKVKNGEIFGQRAGTSLVTVSAGAVSKQVRVTVVDKGIALPYPELSFGLIQNYADALVKADNNTVSVNAGHTYEFKLQAETWYYPINNLANRIRWKVDGDTVTVTPSADGLSATVKTLNKRGASTIEAVILSESGATTAYAARVTLSVRDPFTVSNFTLTSYHGSEKEVWLPDDENIMTIGEEAFEDAIDMEVVIIPKTVTQISKRAFRNCPNLREIYFVDKEAKTPATAKLSLVLDAAFENCAKLEKVDLSNVKTITLDGSVFKDCVNLKEIVHMEKIGTAWNYAFAGCTSLQSIDITGLHVTGVDVFAGCTSLSNVVSGYYTAIGEGMFANCTALESITLQATTISDGAFNNCGNLKSVKFEAYSKAPIDVVFSIGAYAFQNCSALNSVNFDGNPVSKLGDMAFADCPQLNSVHIENANVVLGDSVFRGTPATVTIAGTTTDNGAVYNGTVLVLAPKTLPAGFTIKAGTTEIAPHAFTGCKGAVLITVPASVTKIGEGAFAHSEISAVILPEGIKEIPQFAFYDTPNITRVNIPASVEIIGSSAFELCPVLTTVTFSAGSKLTTLGDAVFMDCEKLSAIKLPDSVKKMGSYVFEECVSLSSIELPALTELGAYTFFGCLNLRDVTFANGATTFGSYTFANARLFSRDGKNSSFESQLANVNFGGGINEIGDGVFLGCSKLTSFDLKAATVVGAEAFANCTALESVTGLGNVKVIGDYAFRNCIRLASINLSSAENIGDFAFYMYEQNGTTVVKAAYKSVEIPKAVTIGDYAFFGGAETTVNIPASVAYIGAAAFAGSSNLRSFTVDENNETYFDKDGVLYRKVADSLHGKVLYELCSYPSARQGTLNENKVNEYKIIDGTVSVKDCAFFMLSGSPISQVTIPYSVKTLGDAAFNASNISTYRFECINAPVLLANGDHDLRVGTGIESLHTMYYTNFQNEFLNYSHLITPSQKSNLKIQYPANGKGYDNYVYGRYFGTAVVFEEIMDDTTRELKQTIDSWDKERVESWQTAPITDELKAEVEAFSTQVKEAHGSYLSIKSQTQLSFLGEESVQKLFSIEEILRPIKIRFGIPSFVSKLKLDSSSTHKTEYKAGERFDMSGLKLILEYDDYSTAEADMNKVIIVDDRALTVYNSYVTLRHTESGKTIDVAIKVTEGSENTETGGNVGMIVGIVLGCVGAVGAIAAVVVVLLLRKKKLSKIIEADGDSLNSKATTELSESETASDADVKETVEDNRNDTPDKE